MRVQKSRMTWKGPLAKPIEQTLNALQQAYDAGYRAGADAAKQQILEALESKP
jgi:hypothetical protein